MPSTAAPGCSSPATCSFSSGAARSSSWRYAVARRASTSSTTSSGKWSPARCGRGRRIDLQHTDIAAGHLIERFRLFFIIALGETVLTTGNAFTDEPFAVNRLVALAIAFIGTVALWWCYFARAEPVGVEAAETAEDAGGIGWLGTWTLTLIVLALIAIAVGDELAIAHPGDDVTLSFAILTFGGPALFLLAQVFFLGATLGHAPRSRPLALVALALLALATAPLSLIAAIACSSAVIVAVAISDTR
jgi:low temperature requirement protein LtrA